MYISCGVLAKLYRATLSRSNSLSSEATCFRVHVQSIYDYDLEVVGFEAFTEIAVEFRNLYFEKLSSLMTYYGAEHEDEILTGYLRNRSTYLQRDKSRYAEMRERILLNVRSLQTEVKAAACGFEVKGVMIAAASGELFDGGDACGEIIPSEMLGSDQRWLVPHPCRGSGTVVVKVVDLCPSGCQGTIDLSQEAFAKIADPDAGKIKISIERHA
ncbi:hypothetical protein J5N97_004996 [Dioscorea zingiberensis]|uniref:Expansin-like EG45 domain-containing protein n=1 Tax=Dioscorea zingiberensis TaxID=325984 RepID=A0A9D5HRF6_9LILI|nr:hypothetical protein J5N97_004996 [Dioscorea zingiberensis]